MLPAVLLVGLSALLIGVLLATIAWRYQRHQTLNVAEQINALLPQTQCGQCNYPGCRPYAEAIYRGDADINQCPPGGQATIDQLAKLLGRSRSSLDPQHGIEKPRQVVIIREDICIGCKKCILVCPVDAIAGTTKKMHTVIESECTGCELCIEPCPVDCIDIKVLQPSPGYWQHSKPVTPHIMAKGG